MKKLFFNDILFLFKKQDIIYLPVNKSLKRIILNLFVFILFVFFLNFLNIIILFLFGYNVPPTYEPHINTLPYEIILIAPFVEEMFFRFPLKKGKKIFIFS